MPFCPICRCEYRPGFTRCSDCDAELAEALADKCDGPDNRELDVVALASPPDALVAQMIQEMLEENGIVSILQSDFSAGAEPFSTNPNAVLVRREDFERGRELYEQLFGGDQPQGDSESSPEDPDLNQE